MSSAPTIPSNRFHCTALHDINGHDLQGRKLPVILIDYSAPQEIGEFTVVTQAELTFANGSNSKVAVKEFRIDPRNGEHRQRLLDALAHKQAEWSVLEHENICSWMNLLAPTTDAEIVIMPWFNNSNILEFQKHNPGTDRLELIIQAARGLASLHGSGLVNGNFSPNNILITEGGIAVVVDGSLNVVARQLIFDTHVPLQASSAFKSPEELFPTTNGVNVLTQKMDVYTFCSTVYLVYAGQLDIFLRGDSLRNAVRIQRFGHSNLLQRPAMMYEPIWALLRRGWHRNPANRPTMDKIVAELESLRTL